MFIGPIVGGFYSPIYNYSVKIIVNTVSVSKSFEYRYLIFPVYMFILARLSLEISWKINEFAKLAVEPLVKKSIILNAYDIMQNKKYSFFQSNSAGNIASKIKGLIDSYESLSREILQNGLFARICKNIGSIIAITTINIWLGFGVLI